MWSKIFKSEPPDVTPPGPFCCAAHRAATRLAPLTRAAATDASGLRPPRSAWQPLPLLPLISLSASYHDSSPALSVDCAAQWALAVTVRCPRNRPRGAANSYGAATRRRPPYRAQARGACAPRGDVRQLRGGGLGYGLAGRVGLLLRSVPQFPAICGRCPVESGAVAFHALTGIKTGK